MNKMVSENIKKIHTWSNGLGVYITKEAKLLKWNQKTYVKISVIKDKDTERVIIEKIKDI